MAAPVTKLETNAVVASCVVFVPGAAVGAVGVPVNDGEAIVARNNISAVFAVMLDVLDVTLVSNAVSAFVALMISAVILAVFAAMALVLLVILAVFAAMALVLLVMLAVLEAINVGNVAIVVELTPPTLFVVVVNVPVPLPLTSPVKVIN